MIKGSKPWRYTGKEENMQREDIKILIKKWWDIYEDESLDYKNVIAVSKAQPVFEALQLEEIDVVDNMDAPSAAWIVLLVLLSSTTVLILEEDK